MYTHKHRDSGVLFTDAPKTSSAKPTGEAPSSLPEGIRRSLREVARKLRDMNPQWKRYAVFAAASLVFMGIFATQELSSRRRLPSAAQRLVEARNKTLPEHNHIVNAKKLLLEEGILKQLEMPSREEEHSSSSDQLGARGSAAHIERYASSSTSTRRDASSAGRRHEESSSAGRRHEASSPDDRKVEYRSMINWSNMVPRKSGEEMLEHDAEQEWHGKPVKKVWATLSVASLVAGGVGYAIFASTANIMPVWVLIALFALPFVILGASHRQYRLTVALSLTVLMLGFATTGTFTELSALWNIGSLISMGAFLFMLVCSSRNLFYGGWMKTAGVAALAVSAIGAAGLTLLQFQAEFTNLNLSTTQTANYSAAGFLMVVIGLAAFGWAFAFRTRAAGVVGKEMIALATISTALLGVIGWQGYEMLTNSTDSSLFVPEVLGGCAVAMGFVILFAMILNTNFGKRFKCNNFFEFRG